MGVYINPGNADFAEILKLEYIDKTDLIDIINGVVETRKKLVCVSRPRRFGKSFAAHMLCAYYDCTCNSESLFSGLDISKTANFKKYLNMYNVVYLDITSFISDLKGNGKKIADITNTIKETILEEMLSYLPDVDRNKNFAQILLEFVEHTGRKIVFIIDEWDAIIREFRSDEAEQDAYLNFLRGIFKNGNITSKVVAAAYMTGILPIKKDGTESAISDFDEYTVLNPDKFAMFTGFTENEVELLCKKHDMDLDQIKKWYDGYHFENSVSIYNPYSVMNAIEKKRYGSYWRRTTATESLLAYINMDYKGLQEDVARLIAGESLNVDVSTFNNDVENFGNKDDVLTLLIHLGYLTYDIDNQVVRIPNEEVKTEFVSLFKNRDNSRMSKLIKKSEKILEATLKLDSQYVAKRIDEIRESEYAPTFYNNEQALRYVIKFAYITCIEQYLKVEELPSGRGIADVVFIPRMPSNRPALVVELKWNKSSEAAINQIKDNKYPSIFDDYIGEVILVGINYDEKTKCHDCSIEKITMHI